VILSDQHEITVDDLPHELFEDPHALVSPSATDSISSSFGMPSASGLEPSKHARSASSGDTSEYLRVDELVRAHVLQVLANVGGNKAAAARKLGIHRRKLYRLLERYQQPLGAESSVIGAEDYVNET
jgi:DNA-binding NtrC family response regulator